MLIDSHAHLDAIDDDPAAVLVRAREAGVETVITIGDDVPTSEAAIAIADAHDGVWATAGLHPHRASDGDAALQRIAALAREPRVVGVGEAGLDYYYEHSPRPDQHRAFEAQIALARLLDKTLVIHTRDAWDDTFRILGAADALPERIVFHCWTGGPDEADRALELGAWLSFSGIVTFRNAHAVREAAALTPLDRMLVETDSPFLAPVPHRGKPNEPAFVPFVAREIAAIKDVPFEHVASASVAAAKTAFALP